MVTVELKEMAQDCLWENTDLPGSDIESRNLTHWLDCVVACDEKSDCETWTYSPQQGACYLKSRIFAGAVLLTFFQTKFFGRRN